MFSDYLIDNTNFNKCIYHLNSSIILKNSFKINNMTNLSKINLFNNSSFIIDITTDSTLQSGNISEKSISEHSEKTLI